jgi:hypothetical protein
MVASVVIGAMSAQNAESHFKRGTLVITPGDREDIILAAAAAAANPGRQLAGMVLTEKIKPVNGVLRVIEKAPFPVLLAGEDSYEVASQVHNLIVKTRAGRHGENLRHPRPHRHARRCQQDITRLEAVKLPFALNPALEHLPVYQPGRPSRKWRANWACPPARSSNWLPTKIRSALRPPRWPRSKRRCGIAHVSGRQRLLPQAKAGGQIGRHARPPGSGQRLQRHHRIPGPRFVGAGRRNGGLAILFCHLPHRGQAAGRARRDGAGQNYGHDLPAMLRAVTVNTKLVFVANPNNPTGTLAPAAEVRRLVEELPENVVLAMDEAYFEFLDKPVDLLPLIRAGRKPNLILLRTFSKIYGLAGLRLGYGIAHPEFIAALEKIRQPFNVNSLAQAAALAALDDTAHVKKTRQNNFKGRKFLEKALAA